MSLRKSVGWTIFGALMLLILLEAQGFASRMCFRAGSGFYAARNYRAAATAFSGSVILDRRFAQGYIQLGSTYIALEEYEQAKTAFLQAKRISDDSCAACGLGMTYYRLGRNDVAVNEFQRAMSLNPDDYCAYTELAKMNYELGRYQDAIAGFKRALTIRPSFGTYVYLGNAHVYAREYEPSVVAYKQAIQLNPENGTAHYQLAIAYDYLQRFEDAAAEYKQTIELDPDDEYSRYALAMIYVSLHNKRAALEQYEILRKTNPDLAAELKEEMPLSEDRQRGKEKLYLVPLGNYSTASLTKLIDFCKQKTGIQPIRLQPVPFALTTIDKRRGQVIAEEAIALMKMKYPDLVSDPNAIVIGVTDEDMYVRREKWQFAFSYRMQKRFALVSSARMNPANLGRAADDVLTDSRLRKMVLKDIGILFYFYPENYDPKSVLFGNVDGVEAIDKMGEDF